MDIIQIIYENYLNENIKEYSREYYLALQKCSDIEKELNTSHSETQKHNLNKLRKHEATLDYYNNIRLIEYVLHFVGEVILRLQD